jgi:2-polyprenyl-3-methyl-5-hydroxy-6-metoxy-1,4-benzoquinol methylase
MKNSEIINSFWSKAYKDLTDGGYISNNSLLNEYRFSIEKKELKSFVEQYVKQNQRIRALDIGCGNGRFTKILATYFEQVDGIDISSSIIENNIKNNQFHNINYYEETLESFVQKHDFKYDFIYVGGVLMYIDDISLEINKKYLSEILKVDGTLILRESVMTRDKQDKISEEYIAYYRHRGFYKHIKGLSFIKNKENLAYRVGELRGVLYRLKLNFLFNKKLYPYLLHSFIFKDLLWKPRMNKLVNYYYLFMKEV